MRIDSIAPIAFLFPLLAGGCLAEVEDDLGGDAVLRSEYPPLPPEDTPMAYAMLRVVNELDLEGLDFDVALDVRAANSIIAHRAGADEVLGTADDDYVEDLAELDSLYWLGEANLGRIQNYAVIEDYVPDELPIPTCDPALAGTIEQCLRFVEAAAEPTQGYYGFGWGPFSADLRPSCLEASDPAYPSTAYFDDASVVPYANPTLGHHAVLCDDAPEPLCEIGVAGVASHLAPQCDALYDVEPVLTEHAADPADEADWAAAVAALDAACGDGCQYWLRVYEYAPGMTPTLLGDAMGQTLASAPLEFQAPWLEREASDTLPPLSAGAQALLTDVIADLGLTGVSYDVGSAAEEVPCPNCHIFYDSFVLMFRDARLVVVLDRDTFWDS